MTDYVETDRFQCADESGNMHTLVTRHKETVTLSINVTRNTVQTLHHVMTIDGKLVEKMDEGRFKITATGEILRKL